jgi:hypothetical protein
MTKKLTYKFQANQIAIAEALLKRAKEDDNKCFSKRGGRSSPIYVFIYLKDNDYEVWYRLYRID